MQHDVPRGPAPACLRGIHLQPFGYMPVHARALHSRAFSSISARGEFQHSARLHLHPSRTGASYVPLTRAAARHASGGDGDVRAAVWCERHERDKRRRAKRQGCYTEREGVSSLQYCCDSARELRTFLPPGYKKSLHAAQHSSNVHKETAHLRLLLASIACARHVVSCFSPLTSRVARRCVASERALMLPRRTQQQRPLDSRRWRRIVEAAFGRCATELRCCSSFVQKMTGVSGNKRRALLLCFFGVPGLHARVSEKQKRPHNRLLLLQCDGTRAAEQRLRRCSDGSNRCAILSLSRGAARGTRCAVLWGARRGAWGGLAIPSEEEAQTTYVLGRVGGFGGLEERETARRYRV